MCDTEETLLSQLSSTANLTVVSYDTVTTRFQVIGSNESKPIEFQGTSLEVALWLQGYIAGQLSENSLKDGVPPEDNYAD